MTNFEQTLELIQRNLNNRLLPNYNEIWVQGHNKPNCTNLLFTIFDKYGYTIRTIDVRNFRQFRINGNLEEELSIIDRHVNSFQSILQEFIKFNN